MAAPMGTGVRRALPLLAVALGVPLIISFSRGPRPAGPAVGHASSPAERADDPAADAADETDPIWANAACYVCHTSFVKEELSKVHVKGKVTCITCHGLSAGHANDEDIGATPPDVPFWRDQIDPLCRRCHTTHDVPARDVLARFLQRRLSPKQPPVCTDCHGRHKIEQPAEEKSRRSR